MSVKNILFTLRSKQWIKNFFIFLPMIFGEKLFDLTIVLRVIMAFFLFSFAASAVYIINDIIDIGRDKLHPTKKLRPIPSGKISINQAALVALVLVIVSVPLSFLLNFSFGIIISVYLLFNLIYSKLLKNAVIIDIFCIAFFFLLRVLAGSVIADVEPSHWIFFMIILLALFLGFNKRRQEIILLSKNTKDRRAGLKGYNIDFIDQMTAIINSSIVVVYLLYTVDARTIKLFGSDHLIYTIPFVYYGIFRYLYILYGKFPKEGDPTRIFLFDRTIQVSVVLWITTCIAVIYFGF